MVLKGKESVFFKLIMGQMLHKPDDKGRMSGRADAVRLVEVAFESKVESLPLEINVYGM